MQSVKIKIVKDGKWAFGGIDVQDLWIGQEYDLSYDEAVDLVNSGRAEFIDKQEKSVEPLSSDVKPEAAPPVEYEIIKGKRGWWKVNGESVRAKSEEEAIEEYNAEMSEAE